MRSILLAVALTVFLPLYVQADGGRNRLSEQKSPYLLQHKDNPVWWWPWSPQAFEAARKQGKPIFLSIGYSTCHWCHVMEHESFEDDDVANYLNKYFVSIKVDREEHPDVDEVYMSATRRMTGRGGWPMTVLLDHKQRPFFAGTYFTKNRLLKILKQSQEGWKEDPKRLKKISKKVSASLAQSSRSLLEAQDVSSGVLVQSYQELKSRFDERDGGFGSAPKFPPSMRLLHLLRVHRRSGDTRALQIVEETLQAMAYGGIYDHLGGGFHRYSTDSKWLIPHFEKMLYDNALLSLVYLEAYVITGKGMYRDIARETLNYVIEKMQSRQGGYFSAEDADSEGREGEFYVWKSSELRSVLGSTTGARAVKQFRFTEAGNFEEGRNVIHFDRSTPWNEVRGKGFRSVQQSLLEIRNKRVHPLRDEKILSAWNGLQIAAMARGYLVTDEKKYLKSATEAASFVWKELFRFGKLRRRYVEGESGIDGVLDDYVFLIFGFHELFQATQDAIWLERAEQLQNIQDRLFLDERSKGYFYTDKNLLYKPLSYSDGARPAANGLAFLNLLRSAHFHLSQERKLAAIQLLSGASMRILRYPAGHATFLMGVDFLLDNTTQVVVVFPAWEENEKAERVMKTIGKYFLPNSIVIISTKKSRANSLLKPVFANKKVLNDRVTYYVCEWGSCSLPTTDLKSAMQAANQFEPLKLK